MLERLGEARRSGSRVDSDCREQAQNKTTRNQEEGAVLLYNKDQRRKGPSPWPVAFLKGVRATWGRARWESRWGSVIIDLRAVGP